MRSGVVKGFIYGIELVASIAGGLDIYKDLVARECYSKNQVVILCGFRFCGGLFGYLVFNNSGSYLEVSDCYSKSNITGLGN